ncbi:hypothetical protein IFM89_014979 [Coptis chinensis]|uniref:protein-serine/threonine phosphatase n=1 Tax=Coptis chinensis TaxID=261450 RepID=A0A835HMB3_9MAGN|nr:hypothetical protein IFM89_014979 [Coptis chinensis]
MLCNASLRSIISFKFGNLVRGIRGGENLNARFRLLLSNNFNNRGYHYFRSSNTIIRSMMVDSGSSNEQGAVVVDVLHEKETVEDGGYVNGGFKRNPESKWHYNDFSVSFGLVKVGIGVGKLGNLYSGYLIKDLFRRFSHASYQAFSLLLMPATYNPIPDDNCFGSPNEEIFNAPPKNRMMDSGHDGMDWIKHLYSRIESLEIKLNEDGKLSCGYSSFRGKRATMEDCYDVKMSKVDGQTVCLFGIFDGHGGSRAAEYLKEYLFENLLKHPQFMTDTKSAISETYKKTDMDFLDSESNTYRDDGSTASTAVLVGNQLYVANVGDSRAVISKEGKAIPLSDDHKPNRIDERKRIESAGGVVMWAGTWRVGGVLAMSRAFGNRLLKQFVVAEPEIQEQKIDDEFELLVLASDGLWDVVANEDAVSLASSEEEPEAAARKLTETAFSRGSADNITCIVVRFHHEQAEIGSA